MAWAVWLSSDQRAQDILFLKTFPAIPTAHRLKIKSTLGLCCCFTKPDMYMYRYTPLFWENVTWLPTPPPPPHNLSILRIDSEGMIDDVIMHDTWCHLCKKCLLTPIVTSLWWQKTRENDVAIESFDPIGLLPTRGIPEFIRKCSMLTLLIVDTIAAPTLYIVGQLYFWSLCSSLK